MMDERRRATAIDRARADLAGGRRALARQRLKNYIVNRPDSFEARRLLMELYRVDGHLDEAGRWGYLIQDGATPAERAAYEHACKHRMHAHWQATYVRKGLHWPRGIETSAPWAAAILEDLDTRSAHERETWPTRRWGSSVWERLLGVFRWH